MDDLKIILLQKDGPPCQSSVCISNLLYKPKTGMISIDSESHSFHVDLKMLYGFDHRQVFFLHHCVSGFPGEQLLGEVGYRVVAAICRLLAQHCFDPLVRCTCEQKEEWIKDRAFQYRSTNESRLQMVEGSLQLLRPYHLLGLLLVGCLGEREGKLCKVLDKPPDLVKTSRPSLI